MVRLVLIRHAATEVSGSNVLLGSTDMEASADGLQQLARLPALLRDYSPSQWFCSPLKRAVQTAEQLRQLWNDDMRFLVDDRLKEIDFGRWENKRFAEIERTDPQLIDTWSTFEGFVFPEGEAVEDFVERLRDFLVQLKEMGSTEVGVVTHGGVIRTMICLALGLDVKNYLLFSVSPGSLTILDMYSEGGVLVGMNL